MSYVERLPSIQANLWSGKKPLLFNLDFELTERCNNNCIHCCINQPAGDQIALHKELTTDELKRILREAADLGALQVRFTGGEPLLRPDFEELYLFARRLGLKVLLFTNGRLITPHLAQLFARIPPLVPIEITVYGMHSESYEAVSQAPGSFAQFWRGVSLLKEHKVPYVVKGALLPPNKGEIAELDAWAAQNPEMDTPPGYAMFFELRSHHDNPAKDCQIRALRVSPEEGLAVLTRHPESYRKEIVQFCQSFLGQPGDRLFDCGVGKDGCVDASGSLLPCLGLRAPQLAYDLRSGSLREALAEVFPHLRELRAENPEYLNRCARCFLKSLCEQCPARSWNEHGTLDTPVEYLCQVAHAQARWLGLIEENEHGWEGVNWLERIQQDY